MEATIQKQNWRFGPKPVVGLAGGIGSGKSHVAKLLAAEGGCIIDADALSRQAINEPAVLDQLVAWWGEHVRTGEGKADRQAIAKIVFKQPEALAKLESVIHPQVHAGRERLREQFMASADCRFIVEDCPLLFEKQISELCDVNVFVEASHAVRLARVQEHRGWSEQEWQSREARQWSLDRKRELADYIVRNEGGSPAGSGRADSETATQVRTLISRILSD